MKILYIGQLGTGTTSLDRMHSLQRLGHEVSGFDITAPAAQHFLVRSAKARWSPRFLLRDLNRQILAAVRDFRALECVWVDKGVWVFPETLRELGAASRVRLVHYTPDSQIRINRSQHFLASIPVYDLLVTTKRFELDAYRELGARRLVFVPQSYCPQRFASPRWRPEFAHDIGFISDCKPNYARIVSELLRSVPDVAVWGSRWQRAARLGRVPAVAVHGDGIWGPDYVDALASFKIGLGLLSKYIPEQHTTRSFEIPAAGSFLLAERTDEHREFFEEGVEAELFDSSEELASKARFYLAHDAERERIAARGRERCRRSGYDSDSVMSRIVAALAG